MRVTKVTQVVNESAISTNNALGSRFAAYRGAMRWERLFEEIEQQAGDVAALERDALAEDLAAETWRQASWLDLAAGFVDLDVEGVGHVRGDVASVGEMIELTEGPRTTWIDPNRVQSAVIAGRRKSERSGKSWRNQISQAFSSRVRVRTYAGVAHEGVLVKVGGDFVQIAVGLNPREIIIPRSSISVMSMLEPRL